MEPTTANVSYVALNETMTYKQIALAMFHEFYLNQAAVITGLLEEDGEVWERGDAVMQYLIYLDRSENLTPSNTRKQLYFKNSNGAPIAHKIFRWQRVIIDNNPKWTIWRVQ